MAMGIVWVLPGILPASIRVAPNSPKARPKESIVPTINPERAKGKIIRQKIVLSFVPKVLAQLIRFLSICSNAADADRYIKGKATTVAAITVAYQVKTS